MESYNYYITVYSVILTLLIASLSLNSIFFIKDKVNKILSFFVFSGIYASIMGYFFNYASIGYAEQDFLSTFIYKGYQNSLFRGAVLPTTSLISTITLIIRLIYKRKKNI
ncbi:hypothetical protein ABIC56_000251 [Acinetobacter bereziniae]|nr:hypothetical protein [Acinetobacter bereziniae]